MSTYRTNRRIREEWRCGRMVYPIDVPAGTRCVPIPPDGQGRFGDYWIDDLSWIPKDQPMLRHDAEHRGIIVGPESVEAEA